ncbi:FAD-binding, type 2 [Metarhizium rileyi]|uniref:FAD-binding, type 2 n=1 Tax=Metarhizium rileyi (strain RCEF 4871) TaxID=1649241 RepID=A0A167B7R9_METRR|nr:FAD-binding, type 2 [Metarhizium rileyi RCEF 4871]
MASRSCELGNLASYAINVTGENDVKAALDFVKKHNIRLTVKNTGHDFLGKSTGKGSLALWMHNLRGITTVADYNSVGYKGPAARVEAGVIGGEALSVLSQQGYRIITGTCPSVGLAGGFSSGGGHSLLASAYGMGSDAVLEWDVIKPNGQRVTATPTRHSDLYWALSGGGSGTYGIVLGITVKIFPDGIVGGGSLTFNASSVGNDSFWGAVGELVTRLPSFVDGGNTLTWAVQDNIFSTNAITVPDKDAVAVRELMAPFLEVLEMRGINYDFVTQTSATYLEHYTRYLGPLPYGRWPSTVQLSSRLVPRAILSNAEATANLTRALRVTVEDRYHMVGCHSINVKNVEHPDNAVIPAWRDAVAICLVTAFWDFNLTWDQMLAHKKHLVDVIIPTLEAATAGSASYMNEMDALYKGDWKKEFYAENYQQLWDTKRKYDPEGLLYGYTAIGSDAWAVDGSGRLCKA